MFRNIGCVASVYLFACTSEAMSASMVEIISPLEAEGIALVGSSHAEFNLALAASRMQQNNPLLPYAVTVVNHSASDVIAYAVLWNCTDQAGKVVPQHQATIYDFHGPSPTAVLASGAMQILSPSANAGAYTVSNQPNLTDKLRAVYDQQALVTISLDLVVFRDGRMVGPDAAKRGLVLKALIDARRDLVNELVSNPSAAQQHLSEIQHLAEPLLEAGSTDRSSASLLRATLHASSYATAYRLAKAGEAANLSTEVQQSGAEAMTDKLLRYQETASYPNLHRGE
jgi:hypothetical protein